MATAAGGETRTRKTPVRVPRKAASPKVEAAPVEAVPTESAAPTENIAAEVVQVEAAPIEVAPIAAAPEPAPEPAAAAEPALPEIPPPAVEAPAVAASETASKLSSQPMVTDMANASFNGYEELASFGKANLDAFIQANSVFVKGIEEISREMFGLTQASLETAAAATTAMLSAKTLKDVVELNADFTKTQYERLLANTTKFGEMGVKLATDTAAPITARANHVVSTVTHANA